MDMKDAVIDGIKRRLNGEVEMNERTYEGVFIAMEWLFEDNGLPSPYSSHGEDYLHWMEDVAEILQRAIDAAEAGREKEAEFIYRQVAPLIARAKQRWSDQPQTAPNLGHLFA